MLQSTGAAGANAASTGRRDDNLALAFQELLTVCERLRSNRQQVSDAESFRHQVREALKMADIEARKRGYTAEDIQLAIFAVVACLDESILNMRSPVFADWPRRPLQEELFGHHIAGEIFFQHLQKILGRNDSHETADLLEVYYLCMLLGFAGRYSIGARAELQAIIQAVGTKIRRIRGHWPELSPAWALPPEQVSVSQSDPMVRKFLIGAIVCFVLALVLFVTYKISLRSGVSTLQSIAMQGR
ncbi:MAG: type IVB secretion system protein IcmH/DotU [Bryobacteraceae bacterium]